MKILFVKMKISKNFHQISISRKKFTNITVWIKNGQLQYNKNYKIIINYNEQYLETH